MPKVLFFIEGEQPTADDNAAIVAILAANAEHFVVRIRNADFSNNYGAGPEPCDYVAGAVPPAYDGVDVLDPENLPGVGGGGVAPNQYAVTSGQQLIATAGTWSGALITFTIVDGEVTALTANEPSAPDPGGL